MLLLKTSGVQMFTAVLLSLFLGSAGETEVPASESAFPSRVMASSSWPALLLLENARGRKIEGKEGKNLQIEHAWCLREQTSVLCSVSVPLGVVCVGSSLFVDLLRQPMSTAGCEVVNVLWEQIGDKLIIRV